MLVAKNHSNNIRPNENNIIIEDSNKINNNENQYRKITDKKNKKFEINIHRYYPNE